MGIVKNFLLTFNAFESSQFFRFNKDHKYTNILGGIFTIFLMICVLTLLIVKIIDVFNTSTVQAATTTYFQFNQVNFTLSPSNNKTPFLIAYEVVQTSSSQNQTSFKNNLIAYTTNSTGSQVLQQCTAKHWESAPQIYKQVESAVAANSILFCLPLNFSHQMSIAQTATLTINLAYQCGSNCSSIETVDMLVRPIILDTLVNPESKQNYLINFLEKRLYYTLSTRTSNIDAVLNYEMSKYSIETDTSVLPFQKIKKEEGFNIPSQPTPNSRANQFPNFVFFRTLFLLTNQEHHYSRSYSKILDAISQIGGLLPIFLVLFIWLNYYALYQFQMVFLRKMHSDLETKQYGFTFFIATFVYKILNFLGIQLESWEKTKEFKEKHSKVSQFLDILFLHKRLQFMQRALSVIFEDHQLQALHLMRNKTFNQASQNLQRYSMKQHLIKLMKMKKWKEFQRNSWIQSGNTIILEPEIEDNKGKNSSQTQKNICEEKVFDEEDFQMSFEEEEFREQVKSAFCSFQIIRQEAENSESDYFKQVSRNILKKLNDQDWDLISNLDKIIKSGEKKELKFQINDFFFHQNKREEDKLFKKPIFELRKHISSQSRNGYLKSNRNEEKQREKIEGKMYIQEPEQNNQKPLFLRRDTL